mmetsp:Transcript_31393/g.80013  ORF Transcript_31393/g.80013 Transcript_31393/m.80013 type:complete len:220 (+) Transcript_31393:385-1044(+)
MARTGHRADRELLALVGKTGGARAHRAPGSRRTEQLVRDALRHGRCGQFRHHRCGGQLRHGEPAHGRTGLDRRAEQCVLELLRLRACLEDDCSQAVVLLQPGVALELIRPSDRAVGVLLRCDGEHRRGELLGGLEHHLHAHLPAHENHAHLPRHAGAPLYAGAAHDDGDNHRVIRQPLLVSGLPRVRPHNLWTDLRPERHHLPGRAGSVAAAGQVRHVL